MLIPFVLVSVISFLFLLAVFGRRRSKYPPGPKSYPIFGNLFQIPRLDRHKTFAEWGKEYGDIVGLQFGPNLVVVLNNYKDIREAFGENSFAGRPMPPSIKDRNNGRRGIIFNEGPGWAEQRRFCLKNLRDLGLGKKSMQGLILEEVNDLILGLSKNTDKPITTQQRFNVAVLNSLWNICCGERFSQDDPFLIDLMRRFSSSITKPSLLAMLSQIFPVFHSIRKALSLFRPSPGLTFVKLTYQLINKTIQKHKESFDQSDEPRDFIDCYLRMIKETQDSKSSFYKDNGELGLPVVLLDLFTAGGETTSTTLMWTCLLLSLNPEKQEKLHKKIVEAVGTSRSVTLEDRPNIPYIEAVVQEVLRYSALIPLGVVHTTLEDVEFKGFVFPKGTQIIPNMYNVSRDKEAWGDPENFRPERFLSADEKTLIRHDAWIPFAVGKRVCPGESLARDTMTLFVGNIFQRFKWSPVPGEVPTMETESVGVLLPKPHNLIVTDRLK